jgi:hypothetical protein
LVWRGIRGGPSSFLRTVLPRLGGYEKAINLSSRMCASVSDQHR